MARITTLVIAITPQEAADFLPEPTLSEMRLARRRLPNPRPQPAFLRKPFGASWRRSIPMCW